MKTFLAESWIWIAVPFLLVAAAVATLLAVGTSAVSPFTYSFD